MAGVVKATKELIEIASGKGEVTALRKAASLALDLRRKVREGDLSYFLLPLVLAIAKDGFLDPLSSIPIIGIAIEIAMGLPVAIFIFIFMWGRGKTKLRIVLFILSVLDIFPIVQMIPFTTLSVLYGYYLARKEARKARKDIQGLHAVALTGKARLENQKARLLAEAVAQEQAESDEEESDLASDHEQQEEQMKLAALSVLSSRPMDGARPNGKRTSPQNLSHQANKAMAQSGTVTTFPQRTSSNTQEAELQREESLRRGRFGSDQALVRRRMEARVANESHYFGTSQFVPRRENGNMGYKKAA